MFPSLVDERLTSLQDAISGLADISVAALGRDDASSVVLALEAGQRSFDAMALSVVRDWNATLVWSDDGHRSAAAWLVDHTQMAYAKASRRVRTALRLSSYPYIAAAFADGRISLDHVETILAGRRRIAEVFSDVEEILVEAAAHVPPGDIATLMASMADQLDDRPDRRGGGGDTNEMFLSPVGSGWALSGTLNAETGAALAAAVGQLEQRYYHDDVAVENAGGMAPRTPAQRRADALGDIAALALASHLNPAPTDSDTGDDTNTSGSDTDTDLDDSDLEDTDFEGGAPDPDTAHGDDGKADADTDTDTDIDSDTDGDADTGNDGDGTGGRSGRGLYLPGLEPDSASPGESNGSAAGGAGFDPAIKIGGSWFADIDLVIPWSVIAQIPDHTEGPATICGIAISADTARQLACDANISRVIVGPNSEPLDVGRSQRTASRAIRRGLRRRDRHCAFPGCTMPFHFCDMHHVVFWEDGGPTAIDNLVALCKFHHKAIHCRGFTVAVDPDTQQARFARPDGRTIQARPDRHHYAQQIRGTIAETHPTPSWARPPPRAPAGRTT